MDAIRLWSRAGDHPELLLLSCRPSTGQLSIDTLLQARLLAIWTWRILQWVLCILVVISCVFYFLLLWNIFVSLPLVIMDYYYYTVTVLSDRA